MKIYKIMHERLQVSSCEPSPKAWRAGDPGHRIFQVLPDALNRLEFWALRRSAHQAHVRRNGKRLGRMRPTVVQPQEIQARREGLREGLDEELAHLRIEIRQFQEEPVAGRRLHGARDVGPLFILIPLTCHRPAVSVTCGPMRSTILC